MNNKFKILFIENDNDYFKFIEKILRAENKFKFDIIKAASYKLAEEIVNNQKIDVILIDFILPKDHLNDTLKGLKLDSLNISIILLSNTIDEYAATSMLPKRIDDCVNKDSINGRGLSRAISRAIERKLLERNFIEYMSIVNLADVAIFSKNLDYTIRTWNKAGEKIYGYTADEMIGKTAEILLPDPSWQKEILDILEATKKGKSVFQYPTKRRCKDGKIIDILLNTTPLIDNLGNIFGIAIIARDITERKISEKGFLIQYNVAKILNQISSIYEAGYHILEEICDKFEWERGELWLIEPTTNVLKYVSGYSKDLDSDLEKNAKESTYHIYEGIHGHIWKSENPFWLGDIDDNGKNL